MKSYRGVISKLSEVLDGSLTREQTRHYTYLQQRARQAEHERQRARKVRRRMAQASRRENRG